MKLMARKYLRYAGKPVQKGAAFESKPADVRLLKALGWAETYVEPPKPKPVPAAFKPIPTIDPDVPVSSSVVMADHEVPSTPTKRGYRRRDMTADE